MLKLKKYIKKIFKNKRKQIVLKQSSYNIYDQKLFKTGNRQNKIRLFHLPKLKL